MLSRLLFTIATAVSLLGLYAVYAVSIRPLVVIHEVAVEPAIPVERATAHRPAENVRVAETYLPEQNWAKRSQYMLRAGQAFVFTNEWRREKNAPTVRFTPFAMVWLRTDKQGREQAVSLVSDSAQLKFASEFDEQNPNPGRVVGAVLDGIVQVKGSDGLAVVGKRFIFDESAPSLVSTNPVQFQYGSHKGSGRSLHMSLIPAEGLPGKDRPHVFGVRTIRLSSGTDPATKKFEYVRLDVQLDQRGEPKPVKIRCSRDLEYDVASQTAVFSKEVVAFSSTGPDEYDYLESDSLSIQFSPKLADTTATSAGDRSTPDSEPSEKIVKSPPYQKVETDLEFERMIAEGRKVKVVSQQHGLRASMTRLAYDARNRSLRMSDPKGVFVSQKGTTLAVPEIELRLGADNSLSEVLCRGTGRLETSVSGTNELAFIATWAKQLRKSTDQATGLDLIELEQQASFRQPDKLTGLGAERIRIWLTPIPMNSSLNSDGQPTATNIEPDPKRLVAEREVALVSPQVVARTELLDVRFDETRSPESQPQPVSRSERESMDSRDSGRSPIRQVSENGVGVEGDGSLGPPIDIPMSSGGNTGRSKTNGKPVPATEPLDLTADRIGVRLRKVIGSSQPEVSEIEMHGRIKARQKRKPGEQPLIAEGDRMNLTSEGPSQEIVHLYGQPAHLRDRGLHIEGRDVHLDRGANRAWVKGGGLLQLPIPEDTSMASFGGATSDPDLDVWWDESMEFDGQTAKFLGKVRSELGLSRMRCEQMNVELSRRLSFSENNPTEQPELKLIRCREEVSFENSEYEGTKLIQVQRGRVAEFTLDRAKDTAFAQGPGHMQIWQRGKSNQAGLAPRDVIQANRPITVVASDWDYTRVDFKGHMSGHIERQRSTFHDSVRIVHGPVKLPNETIDADNLPAEAGSMRCEKLEFAHQSKGPDNPKAYQQLVGHGNAQIEGRGFYATADEISFDGSKGLYMLRAHGNQNATIAQDSDRGPRREAAGRRIEFIPSRKVLYVDRAVGASGAQ